MSPTMTRWCGWAAVAGGAMWAVKGVAILVTGDQPPLLFEAPLALLPLGLLGLHARLVGHGGRLPAAGRVVAVVALVAGMAALGMFAVDQDADGVGAGVAIAGSTLGTVVGLVLLGVAVRRTGLFPPPWHRLPLTLGIATPLLLSVVGGILASVDERLLEVPLIVVAAAWVRLGLLIADASSTVSRPTPVRRSA